MYRYLAMTLLTSFLVSFCYMAYDAGYRTGVHDAIAYFEQVK